MKVIYHSTAFKLNLEHLKAVHVLRTERNQSREMINFPSPLLVSRVRYELELTTASEQLYLIIITGEH